MFAIGPEPLLNEERAEKLSCILSHSLSCDVETSESLFHDIIRVNKKHPLPLVFFLTVNLLEMLHVLALFLL